MPLWKIRIEGHTEMDVQGVNLRETIASIADRMKMCGSVRNKKHTKNVEVVCKCDKQTAENFKNAIIHADKKNPLLDMKRIIVHEPETHSDLALDENKIDEFIIEREDDLTEMVWALQNAGKALLLQEKLRTKSILRGLSAEIAACREVLQNIDKNNISYTVCFPTIAIEGFLTNPPEDYENLTTRLHELYRSARAINFMIREKKDKRDMPLDPLREILDEIEEILKEVRFK
ncbi:MAG: acylphosphatase [Candidatus Aenigmatarchaeota archaeon]